MSLLPFALSLQGQLLSLNPATGDRNAGLMGIVIAALVVSAGLIVFFAVSSRKKGKRK